jgi:hypothetical protein
MLACAGQTSGGALKAGGLPLAAIRVCDAQYLAIGLTLEASDVPQDIDDLDQMLALVVAVLSALARAVLEAFDLGLAIPLRAFDFWARSITARTG